MKTMVIQCEYFTWKLFRRGDVYYADGRSERNGKHSLNVKDEKDARDVLRRLDRKMAQKRGMIAPTPPAVTPVNTPRALLTIAQGWEMFFQHCRRPSAMGGVTPKTVIRYQAIRDKHLKFCTQQQVHTWAEVDDHHAEGYGEFLAKLGKADGTLYMELTTLKTVVKFLIKKKLVPGLQPVHVDLRRSSESSRYCYTREQVSAMIAHCGAETSLTWLRDIVTVLATTGMRIGELVSLQWADIEWSAEYIRLTDNRHNAEAKKAGAVRTTKGKRGRRVPLNPQAMAVLKTRHTPNATGPVFTGPADETLSTDRVLRAFERSVIRPLKTKFTTPAGEIGFENGRLHSFRHYFVSDCFRRGVGETFIRDWVGHSDSRILERYRHLSYGDSLNRMRDLNFFDAPATESPGDETSE